MTCTLGYFTIILHALHGSVMPPSSCFLITLYDTLQFCSSNCFLLFFSFDIKTFMDCGVLLLKVARH